MNGDPIGAADGFLSEVARVGLDLTHSLFIAYFISLSRPQLGAAVVAAVDDGWDVASYADADGFVVRLAHERMLNLAQVQHDRAYVTDFAAMYGGDWKALAVEEPHPTTFWDGLTRSVRRRSIPAPGQITAVSLGDEPVADALSG